MPLRLSAHLSKAKARQTNHHCANWIRSLLVQGAKPTIVAVVELPDDADWQAAEAATIKKYKAAGFDLTNLTGGGDGFHDVHPDVAKRRGQTRSQSLQDPEIKARHLASAGASHSRPDVRMRHSKSVSRAWLDPEKRGRMLEGMRTPDARNRRADATRKRNSDPQFAEQHRLKMRERFADPAWLEHLRRAREKRWPRRSV